MPTDAPSAEKTSGHKKYVSRRGRVLGLKQELERATNMSERELKEDLEKVERRRNALYEAMAKQDKKARRGKPTNFWLFRKLPMELQLKIWKHAIPGPRNVVIEPYRVYLNSQRLYDFELRFRCFVTPPGMLGACTVSRDVLLSAYTTCIEGVGIERKIRFDGCNDTVILLNYLLLIPLSGHELHSDLINCLSTIKRVAIKWDVPPNDPVKFPRHISWLQAQFSDLEKLIIVGNPKNLPNAVMKAKDVLGLQNMDTTLTCFRWFEGVKTNIEQAYAQKKAIESENSGDGEVQETLQVDLMSFFDTRKESKQK